jgi:hypothetical protein
MMPRWRILVVFLFFAVVLSSCVIRDMRLPFVEPTIKEGQLLANTIYDIGQWTARIPYKLALPIVARARLRGMVEKLSLDAAVHQRVMARIESKGLVDEIIPFLIAMQDLYLPSENLINNQTFDSYFRNHYAPDRSPPGVEHSMFQWATENQQAESTGFGLDDYMVTKLVTIYDILYLQGHDPDEALREQLSCEDKTHGGELFNFTMQIKPHIKEVLEHIVTLLPEGNEFRGPIKKIASDNNKLDAISTSLIELVDQQVCKHYRMFATRIYRQQQLEDWMRTALHAEADGRGDGALWQFLDYANIERRYVMHIVVDGLQGQLMEALSQGSSDNPFLQKIEHDRQNAAGFAPKRQHSETIEEVLEKDGKPAQLNFQFIEHVAQQGFNDAHYLNFFKDLFSDANTGEQSTQDWRVPYGVVVSGVSTTPTISVRNLPIAQTGAPVAGKGATGIPNFHFVDRHFRFAGEQRGRPYYFFGNDALRLEELTQQAGMKTMFNRLPRAMSMNCGALYDAQAYFTVDALVNLGVGEQIRDFGEIICLSELQRRAANERSLREKRQALLATKSIIRAQPEFWQWNQLWNKRTTRRLAQRLIDQIASLEQDTMPEYFLYYNPWPDHFAHFKGPFSDEILSPSGELNRLDYWLNRFTEIYTEAGIDERTLFGMSGDHGLTPIFHVLNPEIEVFDRMREEGVDFKVVKISSDEGEGPRLNNQLAPPSMKGIDIVVASTAGGNYMLDLFVDQDQSFTRQPLHEDLLSVKPLTEQDRKTSINIIHEIYTRLNESLDYLAVRETESTVAGGTIRLLGKREGQAATGLIERRGRRIFYQYRQADLLDTYRVTSYASLSPKDRQSHTDLLQKCHARKPGQVSGALPSKPSTWCTEEEWRLLTSYTDRPDAVAQLAHLYDSDRAGTINLFPRQGIGYNTRVPGRHAGEHFHEKNAFIGFWGKPVQRTSKQGRIRTAVIGALPATLYEYLAREPVIEGENGWGFTSLGSALLAD